MWPQQQRMEDALLREVPEVPREDRVRHLEPGRGGGEPGPEDQPVATVDEVVRQGERLLGEAGEAVPHLARDRGEECQADRHVGDDCRGERRVQPVDHAHGRLRHDHRAPDRDEEEEPLRVVAPAPAEGRAEDDPGDATRARELREGHVGAARRDRGDRVQQVDQVRAAAEGEEFVHL